MHARHQLVVMRCVGNMSHDFKYGMVSLYISAHMAIAHNMQR